MNILVVGSGGREHSLAWKLSQSPRQPNIYCAPGNAGTAQLGDNVDIAANDIDGLLAFAKKAQIDLTVVGPEVALCAGIADRFREEGLMVFGPSKAAAALEGDKAYCKDVMKRHSIPTAGHRTFRSLAPAIAFAEDTVDYPLVVKASGLAAGKGVIICANAKEAKEALVEIMGDRRFGSAGETVVIEDFLEGEEVSVLALTDGKTILVLESSQDHKRAFDGDKGPNTGGMGAYSPAPVLTPELQAQVEKEVLVPIVHAMKQERRPFNGVLFAGLMIGKKGPRVLEFNVRFGDPECQALMMRWQGDLATALERCAQGRLDEVQVEWDPRPAVTVVVAQEGYPGPVSSGQVIAGLDALAKLPDLMVFHAGTRQSGGEVVAAGGRVLNVTALGDDFAQAAERAYAAVDALDFPKSFVRRDIAHRVL
ncbi:MAG: phosphoribosylamine--glycine ligase [Planctomycetota bacterium]